jgi:hypothetical protein
VLGGTPGRAPFPDLNRDGQLSELDLNILCLAIQTADQRFDLNDDTRLDEQDVVSLVVLAMGSAIGDANWDGRFDSSDLVLVFQAGTYEDTIANNSSWSTGDWNCDGEFTSADLVFALQQGGWEQL